jgi:hypothetical protein
MEPCQMTRTIRPIQIDGNFAYVTLSQGYVAKINATSIALVGGRNWSAKVKKRPDGSVRAVYAVAFVNGSLVAMHNLLMNPPKAMVVDHIDCDGLNNTFENMRLASNKQNTRNSRTPMHSTTGVKGVHFNKKDKRWQAHIRVDGKRIHLGMFGSLEDAKKKYEDASKKLFMDFARSL